MLLDIVPYLVKLWEKRWFLLINFFLVSIVAVVFTFYVLKKEYRSNITFLPPTSGSISALSMMENPLMNMLSTDVSGDQIETVFDSYAFKKKMIQQFELIKSYKLTKNKNKIENAIREMSDKVILSSSIRGRGMGMSKTIAYNITCFHTNPDTALLMTEYAYFLLDSAMKDISIDKARRNRIFIQGQYDQSQQKLDSIQDAYKEFQIKYKAFDIPEQLKLSLKTYADIKAASVVNDLKITSLQGSFRESTPEITEAISLRKTYQKKLAELESNKDYNVLPSFDLSSELIPEYTDILRSLEIQNQISILFRKELENAKLQEAKDVSPLVMVDPAFKPEYKARPKRIQVIALIVIGYMASLFVFISIQHMLRNHIPVFKGYFKSSYKAPVSNEIKNPSSVL